MTCGTPRIHGALLKRAIDRAGMTNAAKSRCGKVRIDLKPPAPCCHHTTKVGSEGVAYIVGKAYWRAAAAYTLIGSCPKNSGSGHSARNLSTLRKEAAKRLP